MQKPGQFLFHLFAASLLAFGIYYDVNYVHFPPGFRSRVNPFAGRWKYLTFWNLVSTSTIKEPLSFHCILNTFKKYL